MGREKQTRELRTTYGSSHIVLFSAVPEKDPEDDNPDGMKEFLGGNALSTRKPSLPCIGDESLIESCRTWRRKVADTIDPQVIREELAKAKEILVHGKIFLAKIRKIGCRCECASNLARDLKDLRTAINMMSAKMEEVPKEAAV